MLDSSTLLDCRRLEDKQPLRATHRGAETLFNRSYNWTEQEKSITSRSSERPELLFDGGPNRKHSSEFRCIKKPEEGGQLKLVFLEAQWCGRLKGAALSRVDDPRRQQNLYICLPLATHSCWNSALCDITTGNCYVGIYKVDPRAPLWFSVWFPLACVFFFLNKKIKRTLNI